MSDEQEDIGLSMTINDELRLCGMTGDDEDDIVGDAEELFGRRAAEELNAVLLLTHFPSTTLTAPTPSRATLKPLLMTAQPAGLTALLPRFAGRISRSSIRR